MFKTPKNIIVLLTIENAQKTISLVQKFEFSGIYDIIMDKEYHGQVQKVGKGWAVNTIPESPIQRENHESLVNAITLHIK